MGTSWSVVVLLFTMLAVRGTYHRSSLASSDNTVTPRETYSRARDPREATRNTTTDNSGGNEGEEREVEWLGRHWYVFVVFVVMVIVVFVLLCGCLLRRGRLSTNYPLQIQQNGNRFTPHIHTPHSPPLISDPQPPLHHSTPAHRSAHTSSSSTRHTETFFTAPYPSTSSPVRPGGPLLPVTSRSNPPPVPSPSESPWSFIQIVAKGRGPPCRGAELSDRVREEGRRGSVRQKSHHHHHHHRHMSHHGHHSPVSYWQRRQRRSHHNKYLTNPLAKVKGVLDDSGASLCSVPSTSGSVPSDQSSNRSDHSSCSRSENSTVIEVNVNVRLSPDQMDRSKAVAMAALAESARQLAESAANLGFSNEVQMCTRTRSLPHSPYPPPRHSHRHPRHSVTGAPLTTHSPLPPPHHSLDHSSHLFHSHSSSHLPPLSPSLRLTGGDPRSLSPSSRMPSSAAERKFSRRYSPSSLAVTSAGGGRGTEDEGTVVSLDHHSSSSSCHCSSMVTHEQGQRSILTQSPLGKMGGDTVTVNLDRYSSVVAHDSDADVTVVSLDRTERSNAAGDFLLRSMNHGLQRHSATDVSNYQSHCEGGRDPANTSPDPSVRSHKSLHSQCPSQPTTHLNLDSQIEEAPLLQQGPRLAPSADHHHIMNGFSYHPHMSLPTHPYLNPPSPNLSQHQQLQNISEQGESECVHSSDNFEFGDSSLFLSCHDRGQGGEVSSRLAEPDLLLGVKKMERESSEKVSGAGGRIEVERKGKRGQRRERHFRQKDRETAGKGNPDRSKSYMKDEPQEDLGECKEENCVGQTENVLSIPKDDLDSSLKLRENLSVSPLETYDGESRSQSPSLYSAVAVEKAQSPPRSGSALSVSEPLGSTASGYAATGESGSTCDMEARSIEEAASECGPEFEEIQQAISEARSQFSYPLQRLLDQRLLDDKSRSGVPGVSNGLTFPQLSSPESHSSSSSESVSFQSHSDAAQISNNIAHSMQQIQSVDI